MIRILGFLATFIGLIWTSFEICTYFAPKPVPQIYIHIRHEKQKSMTREFCQKLKNREYDNIYFELKEYGPDHTELRFFHRKDKSEAHKIKNILDFPINLKDMSNYKRRRRHYEIWLSKWFSTSQ